MRTAPGGTAGSRSPCRHVASWGACAVVPAAGVGAAAVGSHRPSPPAPWNHARWPPRRSPSAARHGDLPRYGASSPACRDWSDPCRSARPPGAGTLALSRDARFQSMRPASCNRCNSAWCRRFQTPACCQSRRRRQQVMPLPQPISCGSIFQGMPLFKAKMMPVSAARSLTQGRPPLGLGGSWGRSGSTTAHSSSVTRGLLIHPAYHRFC